MWGEHLNSTFDTPSYSSHPGILYQFSHSQCVIMAEKSTANSAPTSDLAAPTELSNPPALPTSSALTDEIRKQVENEQALIDAQRRTKELEDEIVRIEAEKKELEIAKGAAGDSTL
jgi:hypothetical protein